VYTPKAVLLTGGAGFIGSNVLVHLVQAYPDCKFVCLDKVTDCANVKNFQEILDCPNFTFVKGDILAADLVSHLIQSYGIDTIMHFAAETHVDNSFGNSLVFTKTNVLGTHTLLESAKLFQSQIQRFIHVSTDEVYGESTLADDRNREGASLAPTNPYAASKAAAEFLVMSYRKSFNLPIIITRGNNVYGPKQYPEKLIPKFIHLLSRSQPCPLHGTGSNRRSFLYVSDVARAFDCILTKGVIGQIYNIGSNFEVTNKDVLLTLLKSFNLDEETYVRYVRDRCFNDFRYHIDSTSLNELGWEQKVDFSQGIELTKQWYLSHLNHWGDVSGVLTAHPFVHGKPFSESLSKEPVRQSVPPVVAVMPQTKKAKN
jgi:UDP-glucose 4,6-dehydratase